MTLTNMDQLAGSYQLVEFRGEMQTVHLVSGMRSIRGPLHEILYEPLRQVSLSASVSTTWLNKVDY